MALCNGKLKKFRLKKFLSVNEFEFWISCLYLAMQNLEGTIYEKTQPAIPLKVGH